MNKVQTFRRQLMRRNFHLISSVGDEISLFSCWSARRRFGDLVDPRGQRSIAAEHAVDRLPENSVRLRRSAGLLGRNEFAGFSTTLSEMGVWSNARCWLDRNST
jgi:hypothetical protein